MAVPTFAFHDVCERWSRRFGERISRAGFVAEEIQEPGENFCKIKISYKDKYIILWPVTWEYVVNDVLERKNKMLNETSQARLRAQALGPKEKYIPDDKDPEWDVDTEVQPMDPDDCSNAPTDPAPPPSSKED